MGRVIKAIALTMALTGGVWAYSYASPDNTDTYVSRSGLMKVQPEESPGLVLTQRLQDSSRVETADSIRVEGTPTIGLKKPYKAFLYALVPGAVVHGAGHFYAGKTGTGAVLLGSELAGATLLLVSVGMSWENGGETLESFPVAFAGGALFFGSWIYDMIGAPLAVQRENRESMQGKRPDLGLQVRAEDVSVVVVYRFR